MPPVATDRPRYAESIERYIAAVEASTREHEANAKALRETLSSEPRRPARRARVFLVAAGSFFVLACAAAILREKYGRPVAICGNVAPAPPLPQTSGFELERIRFDGKLANGPTLKGSRCSITVTVRRGLDLPITKAEAIVVECGRTTVHTWYRNGDPTRGFPNDLHIEITPAPPSGIPGDGARFDLALNERWGTPTRALVSVVANTATGTAVVKPSVEDREWKIEALERGYAPDRRAAP